MSPASVAYFTVATAPTATTGGSISVSVTAYDSYGNVATGYTGTVMLTSTDSAASLGTAYTFTTGAGQDHGVHTFSVTLNTSGNQKITVADTTATAPPILGVSGAIAVNSLRVTSLTPTATGFAVTFNKPFIPADLTLYGANQNTVADVVMAGSGIGAIHGTLVIDPLNQGVTFKATAEYLQLLNSLHSGNNSVVLPDGIYTITLVSGSGANGFQECAGCPPGRTE